VDRRLPAAWWIAVLAAAILTLVSAKLTAAAIDWNAGTSSAVGDAFTALFTAAGSGGTSSPFRSSP
jgi:hypothetical protein